MSAAIAREQVERMVLMEARSAGDQVNAVERIAAAAGLGYWTIDNIRSGKTKRVFSDVRDAIRSAYLTLCEREVKRWSQELATERAKGFIDDDLEAMEREALALAAKIEARRRRMGANS